MKSLIQAVVVAAVLSVPAVSFAQSNQQPLTRAEVKAQLIQLEKAGYNPDLANDYAYPANVQAAEASVAGQNGAATAYGGVANGSSSSGSAVQSVFDANMHSVDMGY